MPKERQTCTECSMRRQKCDRNIPCSRCIKRAEPEKCTREWPKNGYDPKKHRIYPRPEKDSNASPGSEGHADIDHSSPVSVVDLHQDESSVHPSLRTSASAPSMKPPHERPSQVSAAPPHHKSADSNSNFDSDKLQASVLDFVTWGRSDLADYQVKSFDLLKEPFKNNSRPAGPEQEYSNGFGNINAQQISFLQLLLPRRPQVLQLVDYHINKILWYHACFHGDTFRNELQAQYLNPDGLQLRDTDLRWTALLFAILSASMVCAHDQLTTSWGFQKAERYRLTRQWYKASLMCLNLADYMWRHHLLSVQTVCVLTMSGHILGFSNTQSTLHGAALKIAQGLGLQRLGLEADETLPHDRNLTQAKREKIIRREVGRRVWGQVCNQDWFSIPFSEMYSIQKTHYSTIRPQHIDDRTLLPIPVHEPSATSFAKVIHEIASIMPQAHDALCNASTMYTKYEQVVHYDAKMKALATEGTPSFFWAKEPISPSWPEWIPWGRRSIRMCIAHKTIMVHRSFLGKSLTDPSFETTRKTCMGAAKTILKDARQASDPSDEPMLWIDQAFMVAAGITMSLDIFHRKNTEPEYVEHRKHVENAIAMLSKYEHSMIAIRGVRLLTSLLAEEARLSAEKSIDNYKRKRTHEDESDISPDSSALTPNFTQIGEGSFTNTLKRPKFDVPKFLENFVGSDNNFSQSLRSTFRQDANMLLGTSNDFVPSSLNGNGDMVLGNGRLGNVLMQQPGASEISPTTTFTPNMQNLTQSGASMAAPPVDYGYEAFEQIFPPHAGITDARLDSVTQETNTNKGNEAGLIVALDEPTTAASKSPDVMPPQKFSIPSPLSVEGETPASKRFRETLPPFFLQFKQPEVPGIWGSWDPDKGAQKAGRSEWPQFDASQTEPSGGLGSRISDTQGGRDGRISGTSTTTRSQPQNEAVNPSVEQSNEMHTTTRSPRRYDTTQTGTMVPADSARVSVSHNATENTQGRPTTEPSHRHSSRMWDVAAPGSNTLTFDDTVDYASVLASIPGEHDEKDKGKEDESQTVSSRDRRDDNAVDTEQHQRNRDRDASGSRGATSRLGWFGTGSIWGA